MTSEMPRPFALVRLGDGARVEVDATAAELAALALRMAIPDVYSLTCVFELRPATRGAVLATGRLRARVNQICVVSLEAFETSIEDDFVVRFVPAGSESDALDLAAEDEIPYEGSTLDLGEAAAEQLALVLDPFPRKPGAEMPADETPGENGAFAALGKLRGRG